MGQGRDRDEGLIDTVGEAVAVFVAFSCNAATTHTPFDLILVVRTTVVTVNRSILVRIVIGVTATAQPGIGLGWVRAATIVAAAHAVEVRILLGSVCLTSIALAVVVAIFLIDVIDVRTVIAQIRDAVVITRLGAGKIGMERVIHTDERAAPSGTIGRRQHDTSANPEAARPYRTGDARVYVRRPAPIA